MAQSQRQAFNPKIEQLVYGQLFSAMWLDIPEGNLYASVKRTTKHFMNEAYTGAYKATLEAAGITDETPEATAKSLHKAWREGDGKAVWEQKFIEQFTTRWTLFTTGAMSETDRVRVDPEEREYLVLVDAEIKRRLEGATDPEGNPLKMPTNDKDEVVFSTGAKRTRKEMREKVGEQHGDEYRAIARDTIAKRNAAATSATNGAGSNDPESMGF